MSLFRQPRPVLAVAFACVIAFMGIGLVDPILKPIADDLGAGPAQVSLLFTSYMAVMGMTMLVTGWVSSRLGAKRTLILGLAIIIIGAGLAGSMDSIGGIVGFRAVWGLGNALFIAGEYIHANKKTSFSVFLFASGVILNEILLMVQGVSAMSYTGVPFINELLLATAAVLISGPGIIIR